MKTRTMRQGAGVVMPRAVALAAMLALAQTTVQAADEVDAEPSDVKVSWTNTFKYGLAGRLNGQDATLVSSPNGDDGDHNFGKGLISNRIELLSELDAVHREGFGVRVSAAGWYDSVYNGNTDNPGFAGGAVPNHLPYSEFPQKTRDLNGRKLELRDAFLFGKTEVGGMPLTARLGQHALVWGESLFFANNAIAGGQSAYDISKLLADPTAQAKEFVLPVPQVSAQLQLSPDFSLAAYYQFRHRANRTPSVGSYFSVSDIVGDGAERMWIGQGVSVARDSDMEARDSGQFGLQAKWRSGETDLGLYAIRFHDKDPQQITRMGLVGGNVVPTSYYLGWHEATTAFGASASHSFGDVNVALEGSIRHNQSLASSGHASDVGAVPFPLPFGTVGSDNGGNPAYAVGKTAHLNASALWSLQPSSLWREALFIGEVAWNRMLSCTKSCSALDPNTTKDAVSLRMVFEPTYRQVLPGLDLGVPIGLGYTPNGSRSVLGPFGFPAEGGGDFTIGLNGLYQQAWRFNLAYTNYFGKAAALLDQPGNPQVPPSFTYQQSRKDRDFLSFTVRRSF